jgi:hypothetical protein
MSRSLYIYVYMSCIEEIWRDGILIESCPASAGGARGVLLDDPATSKSKVRGSTLASKIGRTKMPSWTKYISDRERALMDMCIALRKEYGLPTENIEIESIECQTECAAYKECTGGN